MPENGDVTVEEKRFTKNKKIRETGMTTRKRRASMVCKVRDLKIVSNKLSGQQKEALARIFLEYKWIRNAALAAERFDVSFLKDLGGRISVKLPDGSFEEREIVWLGSRMQQSAIQQLATDRKSLAASKSHGHKIGKLKFVSEVASIDLAQFGKTWRFSGDRVAIQKIPGKLKVRGLQQFKQDGIEFANAKIVHRADGYHLLITTYVPRESSSTPERKLGVDAGIKDSFTLSDGTTITPQFREPERLKRLQRKLKRQTKGSKGWEDTRRKLQKEYVRVNYRKDDAAKQLVHTWTCGSRVYCQDEMLSSWRRKKSASRGSRKIHHGILGRVKALLQSNPNTVMLPSWVATTQWCHVCGTLTKHGLDARTFLCSGCGFTAPRDQHAAENMIRLGDRYLTSGTEGSAGGAEFKQQLYAVENLVVKPETEKSLVSP